MGYQVLTADNQLTRKQSLPEGVYLDPREISILPAKFPGLVKPNPMAGGGSPSEPGLNAIALPFAQAVDLAASVNNLPLVFIELKEPAAPPTVQKPSARRNGCSVCSA